MTESLLVLKLTECSGPWRQLSCGLLCMQCALSEGPMQHMACFYLTLATHSASVVFHLFKSHTHTEPTVLTASSSSSFLISVHLYRRSGFTKIESELWQTHLQSKLFFLSTPFLKRTEAVWHFLCQMLVSIPLSQMFDLEKKKIHTLARTRFVAWNEDKPNVVNCKPILFL